MENLLYSWTHLFAVILTYIEKAFTRYTLNFAIVYDNEYNLLNMLVRAFSMCYNNSIAFRNPYEPGSNSLFEDFGIILLIGAVWHSYLRIAKLFIDGLVAGYIKDQIHKFKVERGRNKETDRQTSRNTVREFKRQTFTEMEKKIWRIFLTMFVRLKSET